MNAPAPPFPQPLNIDARPHPLEWNAAETALVVVDMQNGFLKPGGYFDNIGYDLGHAPGTIAQVVRAVEISRGAGLTIAFIQSGFDAHHNVVGGPSAPVWHKSEAQLLMHQRPELAYKLITDGTWDYEIVDELKPRPQDGDLVVRKSRYSAFAGTNLDQVLRARRIRNVVICGVALNVCVETTLRDAYHHEYFPLLLENATHHAGPPYLRDASLWNIERFFGWIATVEAFAAASAAGIHA
jgi:ureidoacrylate peracid hydrolase